jgi:hypothetical protein
MITLPKDWKIYSNSIRDRCRDLIEYKIWSGIDLNRFEMWRQNFKTDAEKYFSACVLDSLIYRSNPQTYALINQMLYKELNNLFRVLGISDLQNFPHCLMEKYRDPLIRLIPCIKSTSPVTKSSNEVLRFMKRYFRISENWIINPWNINDEIKNGVRAFIFIDDFLGTGHQLEEVIVDSSLEDVIDNNLIIYASLTGHCQGVSYLKGLYPKLNIISSETLNWNNHAFFGNYFPAEQDLAKAFYLEMLQQRGITLSPGHQYGYGDLELTFAFEHAAPDNSLQVLHKRNDKWAPLFDR